MSFYVIEPLPLEPGTVLEHSVDALDPSPEWVSGVPWEAGALCHRPSTRRVYRRVGAGTDTAQATPESTPAAWQDLRACNKYAAFDFYESTPTQQSDGEPLRIVLQPARRIDTVGLYGLVGGVARLTVRKNGQVIYPRPQDADGQRGLQRREVHGWYDWFTAPFLQLSATSWIRIPPISGAQVEIEIMPVSGQASVQYIVLGRGEWLGDLEWRPDIDAENYSRIERSFDGNLRPGVTLVRRRTVPRFVGDFVVPAGNVDRVRGVRDRLNGVPALWVGLAGMPDSPFYQSVLLFGIYRHLSYSPDNVHEALAKVEIEEL